jgi:hypothetical protein
MHSSGGTKENYETSVGVVQVDVSSQDLPHTKQENHSLNRDSLYLIIINYFSFYMVILNENPVLGTSYSKGLVYPVCSDGGSFEQEFYSQ